MRLKDTNPRIKNRQKGVATNNRMDAKQYRRRRINISVDDDLYQRLQRIKTAYGFKNVCEFNVALLNILCQYIEAAEIRTEHTHIPNKEAITQMFDKLGNWEETPQGVVPIRHKKHTNI